MVVSRGRLRHHGSDGRFTNIGAQGLRCRYVVSCIQRAICRASDPQGPRAWLESPARTAIWRQRHFHGAAELRGLSMWTGAGRSLICFPVSQGRLINVVAFVPSPRDMEETWFAPGDVKALASEYVGWDAPVQDIIAALDQTFRWGIYDRPPLPYWSKGRVTFLGDAAHPMVPHFGQGAGQAIEDGFALAILLEYAKHDEIPARLKAYQDLRFRAHEPGSSRLAPGWQVLPILARRSLGTGRKDARMDVGGGMDISLRRRGGGGGNA